MLQIILTIYGIVVLASGKFAIGKDRVITGTRARILGLILVLCFPIAFGFGIGIGILITAGVIQAPKYLIVADVGIIVLDVLLVVILSRTFWAAQERERIAAREATEIPTTSSVTDSNNPFAPPRF